MLYRLMRARNYTIVKCGTWCVSLAAPLTAHAAIGLPPEVTDILTMIGYVVLGVVAVGVLATTGWLYYQLRRATDRAHRLAEALSFANDGIWEWDALDDSAYFSTRAVRLLGVGKKSVKVEQPKQWFVDAAEESERTRVTREIERLLCSPKSERFVLEFKVETEQGERWLRARGKVVFDRDLQRVSKFGGTISDISTSKRFEHKLMHRVMHDPLTGLPNRALLHDRLQQQLVHSNRTAEQFSLLILDLNRFKEINDSLGHAVGDELLKASAGRLSDLLRESDTVARLGGDEFAILLPNGGAPRACAVAEKIVDELNKPFLLYSHTLFIRASTGIAVYPEHGNTAETLMQRSDAAMYIAKRGNLGYTLYSEADNSTNRGRIELENDLREAIANNELKLFYQPKIEVKRNAVSGVEALIRWAHKDHGSIAPEQIADLAEKSGLIHNLTEWVVSESFRQSAKWHRSGVLLPVSVNLSVWNIQNPGFVAVVRRALAQWRLPAELVEFEITENAMIVDPARAHRTLDRLSELGLSFSVDDFGTGFSSLAYLQRLPVGTVKIDRSFVRDMHENEFDRSIVQSTIDMAHNLGLRTVAEGVEEEVTREMLAEMGCDELQGFLFAKPLSANSLETWLAKTSFVVDHNLDYSSVKSMDSLPPIAKVS